MSKKTLYTAFFMLLSCSICMADTVYVEQSGGGDYTIIQEGIDNAYESDIVKIGPGTYHEEVIVNKSLEIIGSGPNVTFIVANKHAILIESSINVTISALSCTGGDYGILARGKKVLVRNCILTGCGASGISLDAGTSEYFIYNNTIVSNSKHGVSIDCGGFYPSDIYIRGNIIAFNGSYGVSGYGYNGGVHSYNNVFSNLDGDYGDNKLDDSEIAENPRFIDKDNGNYILKSDSPCIDSGRPSEVYNDPDGTRNDMGAFAGPDAAAFWPYIAGGPTVSDISVTPASVPQGGTITIEATGRVQ